MNLQVTSNIQEFKLQMIMNIPKEQRWERESVLLLHPEVPPNAVDGSEKQYQKQSFDVRRQKTHEVLKVIKNYKSEHNKALIETQKIVFLIYWDILNWIFSFKSVNHVNNTDTEQ